MSTKHSSEELDAIYHALANSTRRLILTRLAREGRKSISDLAEPFDMSLAAVSKHIRVLEKAGLIEKQHDATTHYCHVNLEPIVSAGALIQYFQHFLSEDERKAA